jgi:WD40 repeat protein
VWDAASGEGLLSLVGHSDEVRDVAWSPDGKWIATASADGTARVWHARTGTELFALPGLSRDLQSVAWSTAGDRLATSGGGFIRLWNLWLEPDLAGHTGAVLDARRSPDGTRMVTAGADGTARVWDAITGEPLLVFSEHGQTLHCASWSPSGDRIVTSGADGTARIWDPVTGEELVVFAEHTDEVWHADWSSDGRYVVTTSADRTARVWDSMTGEPMSLLHIYHDRGRSHWSPDGQRIVTAAGYGGTHLCPVFVWDAASGENLLSFLNHDAWMSGADWSPDGKLVVSAGYDGTARIWNPDTGEEKLVLVVREIAWDAAWSPNGKRIVTADQRGAVKVWDAATGVEVYGFSAEAAVLNVDWSSDGQYITASGLFEVPVVRRAWQSTDDLIAYARECCVSRELTPEERERFGLPRDRPSAPALAGTPEPTPTAVEILATKPEHLAGTWLNRATPYGNPPRYYRFEADGTVKSAFTLEELQESPWIDGRFWFEGGVYYEEGQYCVPIGSYRVFLQSEGGRAVALRFEEIDDSDPSCFERSWPRQAQFARVD